MTKAGQDPFSADEPERFEQYVLESARRRAAHILKEMRARGWKLDVELRGFDLRGKYPDTVLAIRTYSHSLQKESTDFSAIWNTPGYSDKKGEMPRNVDQMIGDFLMWAEGG